MAIFDYLVIAFALLFTAAAMRLIGGLPSALAAPTRYWVHTVFVLVNLFGVAFTFWNFYALREVTWTLPKFLMALSIPGLLYYVSSVIIPENPADIGSWRAYYYSVHVRYFLGLACWLVVVSTMAYFFLGMGLAHPARLGHVAGLMLALVGAFSSSPRVHGALAVTLAVLLFAMTVTIATQPGWLNG